MNTPAITSAEWGIRPILFSFNGIAVPAYSFFLLLAVIVGLGWYLQEQRQQPATRDGQTIYIVIAALFGGIIGAKIPIWIANWRTILASFPNWNLILSGRTIIGGMIGGAVAVFGIKRLLQIEGRRGNVLAPALALAISVGRVGCFLRGCCYGVPTTLPWGVDFGDSLHRHPTQLYELLYLLVFFGFLCWLKRIVTQPGHLFDVFIVGYFGFRFAVEFIRIGQPWILGLTVVQVVCLAAVLYRGSILYRAYRPQRLQAGRS
jgi:phosphatidylglycerol---prolipoprotein diacylglyceryl transferase